MFQNKSSDHMGNVTFSNVIWITSLHRKIKKLQYIINTVAFTILKNI